jgi:deazaflavin-dependent oxidoreductase (nitroreductase family)
MPLPKWLAQLTKHVFNPMEIRRGVRPVLIHVGRSSGRTFETPLDAHPVEGGYVFIANYGRDSDWVRNILAAGTATLRIDGNEVVLASPRMISKEEALLLLPATSKWPPSLMKVTECLRMDVAG